MFKNSIITASVICCTVILTNAILFQLSWLNALVLASVSLILLYWSKNKKIPKAPKLHWTLALAIIARLILGWLSNGAPENDYAYYHELAHDILGGASWLNPNKPTGTALLHAPLLFLIDGSKWAVILMNTLLTTLELILWHKITSKLASTKAANWVALLLAFYPERFLFTPLMCSEIPFSFLTSLFAFSLFKNKSVQASAATGIAQYFRPTAILYLPFLFLEGFFAKKWKELLVVVGIFLFVVSPILYFNKVNMNIWSPNPSQLSGNSALMGSHEARMGTYSDSLTNAWHEETLQRCGTEYLEDMVCADQVAHQMARENWNSRTSAQSAVFLWKKMAYLWFLVPEPHSEWKTNDIYFKLGKIHKKIVHIWAILGLFFMLRERKIFTVEAFYIYLILITTLLHAFLEVSGRYVFMIQPFMVYAMVLGIIKPKEL